MNAPLEALRRDLERHPPFRIPRFPGFVRAAVAVVLVPRGDDLALVLIGRPVKKGDRWAGDIAFPGGLASADDSSGVATARREAFEEVGISLRESFGFLSDRFTLAPGASRPMRVRPVVFVATGPFAPTPDPREVAAVYEPTLAELRAAEPRKVVRQLGRLPLSFDGRALGEHTLWGLTASMVAELEARIARGALDLSPSRSSARSPRP
ncbi:MAG: CoA pyrophosphatase [Polyangiales bacterium]